MWTYNRVLEICKDCYKNDVHIFGYDMCRMIPVLKLENPKLKNVYSQTLNEICMRVDDIFGGYLKQVDERKEDEPKIVFPGPKTEYNSFAFYKVGYKIVPKYSLFSVSKIGAIEIDLCPKFYGEIAKLIIRKNNDDEWCANFICKIEVD